MDYSDETYISTNDLLFKGVLYDIKKSRIALQPIFEAFTNALEAIKIRFGDNSSQGIIIIDIHATKTTGEDSEFQSLTISDNGIGFNTEEFKRFNTYKDFTKGFKNLGSGRIQFVHFFDATTFTSIFNQDGKFYERQFITSKKSSFLDKNAIVFHRYCKETDSQNIGTSITFSGILENSNIYNGLDQVTLKQELTQRYINYFCYNRKTLPKILINFFVQTELKGQATIKDQDIPQIDKQESIKLHYSKLSSDGRKIEKSDKTELFVIDAYKIDKSILKSNDLKFVSKGEVVEESNIALSSLSEYDHVKGFKYLFLVSGEYIDRKDTNIRGVLNIPKLDSFTRGSDLFTREEIVLEDIQDGVNSSINKMYPEVQEVQKKHNEEFAKLKEMFLLEDQEAEDIKISVNDSESKILEKFYEAEAKKTANIDAAIKRSIDRLNKLDTRSDTYCNDLQKEINSLTTSIPLQNKTALTRYIARRKLVIDLFSKILNKELEIQQDGARDFDEALIHNLLFQQSSEHPENSDLWILNEDFIYFKGSSEKQLSKIKIGDELLFKSQFSAEEDKYLKSLGENRLIKRPDVLLFPEEGKCIIIEFKAPDVNVSEHLTQINTYANFILNYTEDKFRITQFYGYLIGEGIEPRDVLSKVSSFEHSYQFDYLYQPATKVISFSDERPHGSIYTEVIKYTTLLARAKKRNQVFLEKLQQL